MDKDKDIKNISADSQNGTNKSIEKTDNKKPAPKKKPKISIKERVSKALREYKSELKKIVWFNREQTFKSSVIVLISVVVVSIFIGTLDYIFSTALMWLGKII